MPNHTRRLSLSLGVGDSWYVRDDLVDENYRVNTDRVAAVGRMAGYDYCRTRDRFTLPNGFFPEKKAALDATDA